MDKYRKVPVVIEAQQWQSLDATGLPICSNMVAELSKEHKCKKCGVAINKHGWIDKGKASTPVCPGDWIIRDELGEYKSCKPDMFKKTYELVEKTANG